MPADATHLSRNLRALRKIVLHASNLAWIDATMQKQRIQIELDGVDCREAKRSSGQRVFGQPHLLEEVRRLSIMVGQQPNFFCCR